MNDKVNFFFDQASNWQREYLALRKIVLACDLTEELKWGVPCYTYKGSNIVLIHGFKNYCALLFHKGALLNNGEGVLVQQTKNVQSARQIRFTGLKEIAEMEPLLRSYIFEAIEAEKAGLEVKMKKTSQFEVPEEFQKVLDQNHRLQAAFERLTPGRQRGYLLYFSAPKQSKTRVSRIEKSIRKILEGKGLND